MEQNPYLPSGDTQKELWLQNFDEKLLGYAKKFGLDKPTTDSVHNDRLSFGYSLLLLEGVKTFEHTCVKFKDAIKVGALTNLIIEMPIFVAPAGMPTVAIAPGIFKRTAKLVKTIKNHPAFTETIGKDLGIIGTENLGKDNPDDIKVKLSAKEAGGSIQLKYLKGEVDGIKLESKRGTETEFTLLDKIAQTTYIDDRKMLVAGTPEVRQYRAWPILKDKVVGKVSDVVSITVTPV